MAFIYIDRISVVYMLKFMALQEALGSHIEMLNVYKYYLDYWLH